jgi:hypothetical protein
MNRLSLTRRWPSQGRDRSPNSASDNEYHPRRRTDEQTGGEVAIDQCQFDGQASKANLIFPRFRAASRPISFIVASFAAGN